MRPGPLGPSVLGAPMRPGPLGPSPPDVHFPVPFINPKIDSADQPRFNHKDEEFTHLRRVYIKQASQSNT
jgi:hypothetical protein